MTLANRLTLLRAALVFPFAFFVLIGQPIVAGLVFAVAAATDLLDGYVARRRQEETALGAVLDPIADKMLTVTALLALIAAGRIEGALFVPALVIALRELWVSGLREGLIAQGGELPVSGLAKVKTTAQLLSLFLLTISPWIIGDVAFWIAGGLTFWTGLQYTRLALTEMNLETQDPSMPS